MTYCIVLIVMLIFAHSFVVVVYWQIQQKLNVSLTSLMFCGWLEFAVSFNAV